MPLLIFLFFFLAVVLVAAVLMSNALYTTLRYGLPYVSSPDWTIAALSEKLHLGAQDVFVELGCGDARVLAGLAKHFPEAKYIGYEIQWWPFLLAKWRCRNLKNISIQHQNFLSVDLSSATIIYGYFISSMMPKVAELLKHQAGQHTLISLGYELPGFTASEVTPNPRGHGSSLRWYTA